MSTPSDPRPTPGLTSGDPLGGSGAGTPPAFPPGYTSPPPPGAGGRAPLADPAPFPPGAFRLSGWWRRVGAAIIDGVIIGVLSLVVLIPLGIGAANIDSDTGAAALVGAFILTVLAFVAVGLLYAPVMMSRTNGQTLGRMAFGIRVIRANGQPVTFGFAALRELAVKGLLFGLLGSVSFGLAPLLDVLWPLWDDENRALHDLVVNTRTVRA